MILKSTPCQPSTGKTFLVIGQDLFSITNYTTAVERNDRPAGLMAYSALRNPYGNLTGLWNPINYGAGIEWSSGLIALYPNSSIQLGLWLVGACNDVIQGSLDEEIHRLAHYVRSSSSTQFYIRIGYEFDYYDNNYIPSEYIPAFQRIVRIFRELPVHNVAFVWHSAGLKNPVYKYSDFYPGDEYVDWCGVSIFEQPYDCESSVKCYMKYPEHIAEYCAHIGKPLMIAESTPFGGIVDSEADGITHNQAG